VHGLLETSYKGCGCSISSPVGSGAKSQLTDVSGCILRVKELTCWQLSYYTDFLYTENVTLKYTHTYCNNALSLPLL